MTSGGDGAGAGRRRHRCSAASDRTNGICRGTGGIFVTNGRSGVHNTAEHVNAHIARHIAAPLEV
jgi:hypothetical protein